MKGLHRIIFYVFLLIVGFLILAGVLKSLFTYNPEKISASIVSPSKDLSDKFDYTSYILSSNPIDLSTYDECKNLKNAIKYAIITGKPYKVDEIAYGNDLSSSINLPFIGDCLEGDIEIPIGVGINQTVCRFKPISNNPPVSVISGGISDASLLDFDNCTFIYNQYYTLPLLNLGPKVEELNFNPATINLYYSPEHFYIRNGDYSHYPSINNNAVFGNAYNGPGRLKIYVGNATSDNGECKFNIYFCPRPAIAKSKLSSTISIFKIFRDLEIYDLPSFPYYIKDLSKDNTYNDMSGYSKGVYYWNSYDVELDDDYRVETIINAIKAGLYFNAQSRNYFFAQPHWDISKNSAINRSTECWDVSFDNLMRSSSEFEKTRSIKFNCGNDNVCIGDLGIQIAIRKDYRTDIDIDGDGRNDKATYISGVISFCDDGGEYKLTVFTPVDKYGKYNITVANVPVTVDGITKLSNASGIAIFGLNPGSHTISVGKTFGSREFSHVWDEDCDSTYPNWYLDTGSNPYTFEMYNKNKNITMWYKISTQIKNLNYVGSTISGKLLDNEIYSDTIIKEGNICTPCTNVSSKWDINRNVTLEYYSSITSTWQTINTVDTFDDGSFSYPWTCSADATRLRANYTSLNWYYANSSREISLSC